MKSSTLLLITLAAVIAIISCTKEVGKNCNPDGVYTKWSVATINLKSYVFPAGLMWDTTYDAEATDYIDLSTKGEIIFYINQQQHIDSYDTTKYDLLKDSLVTVTDSTKFGLNYVALSNVSTNNITLEEKSFGIDTESEIIYNLKK